MVELLNHPEYRSSAVRWRMTVPVVLALTLALIPSLSSVLGEPFYIRLAFRIIIFATAATALNIVLGYGGMICLMHAGLFGLGAYGVGILAFHVSNGDQFLGIFPGTAELLLAVPVSVLIVCAAAALMGWVSLRTSGTYFIMITLGFNQMLFFLFVGLELYGGEDGLQILAPLTVAGFDASNQTALYYLCLGLLVLTIAFVQGLSNSRFGLVLRATAQNPHRVMALGIPTLRYRLVSFVISGAIVGLAGAMWLIDQRFVSPADMNWVRSGDLVVMCVLGGLNRAYGPLIGATAFILLEYFLSELTIHWQLPFGFIVILIAMTSRSASISRLAARLRRSVRHGVA